MLFLVVLHSDHSRSYLTTRDYGSSIYTVWSKAGYCTPFDHQKWLKYHLLEAEIEGVRQNGAKSLYWFHRKLEETIPLVS
jgi:hypothetical protein